MTERLLQLRLESLKRENQRLRNRVESLEEKIQRQASEITRLLGAQKKGKKGRGGGCDYCAAGVPHRSCGRR